MENIEQQSALSSAEEKEKEAATATGTPSLTSNTEGSRTLSSEELKLVGGGVRGRPGTPTP